jgi:hypothetical protein
MRNRGRNNVASYEPEAKLVFVVADWAKLPRDITIENTAASLLRRGLVSLRHPSQR